VTTTAPIRTLHVGISWSGAPKISELEPVFNNAIDWIRYAPNCWVIRTTEDADQWYERIRHYMTVSDKLLIVQLDLGSQDKYSGWLEEWMWPRVLNR
jgi:hypothetical protein